MATNRFTRQLAAILRETADTGAQSWRNQVREAGRVPRPELAAPCSCCHRRALERTAPQPPTAGRPSASAPTVTASAPRWSPAASTGRRPTRRAADRGARANEARVAMDGSRPSPEPDPNRQARAAVVLTGRAIFVPFSTRQPWSLTVSHGNSRSDLGALSFQVRGSTKVRMGSPVRCRRPLLRWRFRLVGADGWGRDEVRPWRRTAVQAPGQSIGVLASLPAAGLPSLLELNPQCQRPHRIRRLIRTGPSSTHTAVRPTGSRG